jgi:hypothetical protein
VIALFKQKSPANIVLLFIFGLLIKLPLFLYPKVVTATENDGRLYHALISFINGSAMLAAVVSFLLLYVQALMINYLVNEYRMTSRQTFLPAMAYMLITSLLPEWSVLSAALVANTFIILIFIALFSLYNVGGANGKIYNIGLLAGLTSFIFFPSLLFVLAILMGIMILRPFRLNEIFLILMGATTPYYFYAVYLFLTGRFDIYEFFPEVSIQVPQVKRSLWLVGSTILITIPFLIGGYYIQNHLRKMLIQARKNWSILLLFLLLAFLVPFVNSTQSFHTWVLTTAPFAAFHACAYLYPPRKWLPLVLFTAMLLFILAQQYATPLWH